jgi:hypothetical protein
VEQELLTVPEHSDSLPGFGGVRGSILNYLCSVLSFGAFLFCPLHCMSFEAQYKPEMIPDASHYFLLVIATSLVRARAGSS